MIDKIAQNEEVKWKWTIISQCINSDDAIELLREIVTLWVTVRGFSITAMWMEVYKKVCQTITTKRAGLRKELRQSSK